MIIDEEDYLEHYGVKGMRWGVRNEPERVGRRRKSAATKEIHRQTAGNLMQAKYGSASNSAKAAKNLKGGPTAAEKKARQLRLKRGKQAALIGLGVVGLVGVGAAAYYVSQNGMKNPFSSGGGDISINDITDAEIAEWNSNPLNEAKAAAEEAAADLEFERMQSAGILEMHVLGKRPTNEVVDKFGPIFNRFNNMDDYYASLGDDTHAKKMIERFPAMTLSAKDSFYRMAGDQKDAFLDKDYAFVNLRENDHKRYQAIYKATFGGVASSESFSHTLAAKKALKFPSGKDVIAAAKAVQSKVKLPADRNLEFLGAVGDDPNGDFYKNLYVDIQGIIKGNSYKDRPGTKALVEELKRRGFAGMPDVGDYGRSTRSSMVLFDPDTVAVSSSVQKLTSELILKAIKTVGPDPFKD